MKKLVGGGVVARTGVPQNGCIFGGYSFIAGVKVLRVPWKYKLHIILEWIISSGERRRASQSVAERRRASL